MFVSQTNIFVLVLKRLKPTLCRSLEPPVLQVPKAVPRNRDGEVVKSVQAIGDLKKNGEHDMNPNEQ